MGKGKKKNRNDFLNDMAEAAAADVAAEKQAVVAASDEPKLTRKQQRELKLAKKKAAEEERRRAEGQASDDDQEDDDGSDNGGAAKSGFGALDSSDEEGEGGEDDEDEEGEGGEDAGAKASVAFAALNMDSDEDDSGAETTSKSKKSKKDKKDKKKSSKKKSKGSGSGSDNGEGAGGSTFYGNPEDEGVYTLDQNGAGEDGAGEDGEGAKKGRGKGGKLSNKERRKLKEDMADEELDKALRATANKETDFAVSATTQARDEAWENATDINIPSFNVSAYGKTLFQNAELKIAAGRKYGVVGPNGHGKSTLLKQIASGELAIPPKIDCLYVEQEVRADDTPAVEMVLQADTRRTELMEREKAIMATLEGDVNDELTLAEHEQLQAELKDVTDELRVKGNDSAEARALGLLNGLGFTKDMQRAPTKSFSGGWRMRVSIARALFLEPTLMLLDEPTNHLDLNAVLWLDTYLQKWKKTLLIVSHDEDFLDSVCTDIIHLDQQRLFYYKGNFAQFKDQYEIHKEKIKKEYEKQEKQLRQLKSKGTTNKKAAEALAKKSKREGGASRKAGKKGKGQGEEEEGTTGALAERQLLQRPRDYEVRFTFPPPTELAPPIIQVDNVSFSYGSGPRLFKKVSFGIDMDSRITIVGPNGVGKSTLLKLMTGELEPTKGEVKINRHLRIARYHQHFVDVLPVGETPVEFLRRVHKDVSYQDARNRLGKFGLEGTAHTIKMINCSGGQKARVVFASMSFQNPHLLILDEPTNNLDLESIDALCEAINEFDGGVVVVTHDARLIQECECRLWVVENQTVAEQVGGFEAYRDEILDKLAKEEEAERRLIEEKQRRANEERKKKLEDIAQRRKNKDGKPTPSPAAPAPAP